MNEAVADGGAGSGDGGGNGADAGRPRKQFAPMKPLATPGLKMSTVFGLGFCRPAPGTWGSLPPVVIAGAMIVGGVGPNESPFLFNLVMVVLALVFSAACVVQGDIAEARFRKHDPREVVADETAGMALALIALPLAWDSGIWHAGFVLLVAFLLFRGLDIAKAWPMSALQRVPGGWGILLDDLAAGAITLVALQVLLR